MQMFDVVVVGGGPAGGQCARELAKRGRSVLLVERHKDFTINSFSSAGTPIEALQTFDLPETVIGSYWNALRIITSNQSGMWQSESPQGAVLDFSKLRDFLAAETRSHGGEVWMGYRYASHQSADGKTLVSLRQTGTNDETIVSTSVLVDATGPARAIMYSKDDPKPEFVGGTGIEYLIEVDEADYKAHANALTFFLGYKWIPKGYSWIFPMEANRLKVGAGWINAAHQVVSETESLRSYVDLLIHEYIKPKRFEVVDIHGSTLKYSMGLNDIYYRENVIAIGDAVSTVNFLGGEGIRHGMLSANIACKYIEQFLDDRSSFQSYQAEMRAVFLNTWKISERLGMKKYLQDSDTLVDKVVTYLKPLTLEDVVDILFYYKFEKASKGLMSYFWRKLTAFFTKIK